MLCTTPFPNTRDFLKGVNVFKGQKAVYGISTTATLQQKKLLKDSSMQSYMLECNAYSYLHLDITPEQLQCTCKFHRCTIPMGADAVLTNESINLCLSSFRAM